MAQHDYDIANQSGANFRADLNNALDAIVSNNSSSSEPSTKYAYEWWIDTSANVLKLRNSANNAWITLPLSITADNSTPGGLTVNGNLATTGTVDINGQELILDADADTSITSDTDDQIDFKIGGTDVATLTNSHLVLKGTTPKITIGDGGEEDTALIFDGNAQDFYIGLDDSADDLVIGKDLNVGIGTPSPQRPLHLHGDTSGDIIFAMTNNSTGSTTTDGFNIIIEGPTPDVLLRNRENSNLRFLTNNTERARIDSSGNLGIGLTNPNAFGTLVVSSTGNLLALNATSGVAYQAFYENGTGRFYFGTLNGADGLAFIDANGSSERARFDADGKFFVAKTAIGRTSEGHEFTETGFARHTVNGDKCLELVRKTSDGEVFEIFKDSTLKQIMGTASNTIFSDENVKKDIKSLELGLDLVKKLNPTEYRHITDDDDSPKSFGLLAQEFEKSLEEVGVEKNSTYLLQHKPSEEATNSDYWLDYQKLTPVLIKAIQELEARVQELEE